MWTTSRFVVPEQSRCLIAGLRIFVHMKKDGHRGTYRSPSKLQVLRKLGMILGRDLKVQLRPRVLNCFAYVAGTDVREDESNENPRDLGFLRTNSKLHHALPHLQPMGLGLG